MGKVLDILESKKIMEKYGVKFAASKIVKGVDEGMIVANNIGYPVALKIVSGNISHKTEAGGVIVGIRDDSEFQTSFRKMVSKTKRKAKIRGVMVQKMAEGAEVLIGGKKDEQFGQVIAFGLGGIFVEIMEDVSFRLAPINKKEAREMISEIKGFKILDGYRGKSYDVDAIATLLVKVSRMLDKNKRILEMDINPAIVSKKGILAVDARIVVGD